MRIKVGRWTTIAFGVFAIGVSVGCVALGVWQLQRLGERQARNAQVTGRLAESAIPLANLRFDSAVRFRRVTAAGRYDFANELVQTSRTRLGAPGVHILTPMRTNSGDTVVLVNRGWAYAPDGMSVDLTLFREDSNAIVDGFVEQFTSAPGTVSTSSVANGVRYLDRDSLAARLPYPLAPVLLVQRLDSGEFVAVDRGTPVRADPPPLGEGPHRAYAIQWFAFALVGVVGTFIVLRRPASTSG